MFLKCLHEQTLQDILLFVIFIATYFFNRYHIMNIVAFRTHKLYGLCLQCSIQTSKILQKSIARIYNKTKLRPYMKSMPHLMSESNENVTNCIDEWDRNNYGKVLLYISCK